MKRAPRQAGFTLLPVVLAMTLIAAIAFLLNRGNGINAQMIANQSDVEHARYAAEAGLQAVNYQVQQAGCGGGFPTSAAPVTNNNFGGASYTAYANQASGFPLTLTSTGSYNGASVTLTRANVQVYQAAMKSATIPGALDTYVEAGNPTWNYGGNSVLRLRTGNDQVLLQFDLSTLPAGSRVVPTANAGPGATLNLYQSAGSSSTGQMSAYLITQAWVAGTLNGGVPASGAGATWNTYDGNTADVWPSPAGYNVQALNFSTVDYSSTIGWFSWDVTDAAAAWIGGVYPNYGLWLKTSNGSVSNASFVATDDTTNTSEHPYVTLNYLAPCTLTTTVTVNPSQDTWIYSASANSNYGGDTTFTVRAGHRTGRALIQFDLSTAATGIPAGTVFSTVTLNLWTTSFTAGHNATSNLTLSPAYNYWYPSDWTEGGATWNTYNGTNGWQCGPGACFAGTAASTTISSSYTGGSWLSFSDPNLTTLVQQWFDGSATNYGLVVQIDDGTIVFDSKDPVGTAPHPPQLVITYQP